MATVEWNAGWNTAIAATDERHCSIIFYINELEQAGREPSAVGAAKTAGWPTSALKHLFGVRAAAGRAPRSGLRA